ncbi:MAG: hypothetical protein ABIK92_17140 [Pseudomonadota bacterium]
MKEEETIKKPQKKRLIIFIVIIILSVPILSSLINQFKLNDFAKKTIPYTDNFLQLLTEMKYNELCLKYAVGSGLKTNDIKIQADKIGPEFGVIKSFSYKGMSFSQDGIFGDLTGVFLYYTLGFNNEKSYTGTFSIFLDKETKKPIIGKIFNFTISGDYGEKHIEIRLIN